MASGKYEKNNSTRTIYKPRGKYINKPNPQKYKMPRHSKQKIFALIGAALTVSSITIGISNMKETSSKLNEKIPGVETLVENYESEKATEPEEEVFTIGIANYDAEITVNGKNYSIGNSFVIASDDEVIVSDVHGNFLTGQLNPNDYQIVTQKTESEMAQYNYFQVISDSPANVRSFGEISDDNVISTVPNGDYVLAYKANTPEYDGEWLTTLSIYDGHLYEGYMREDVLNEVGTVEAINYRTEQSMENIQNMAMVDTSKDGYISLNLRVQPGKEVITKIPFGSFVEILEETTQYGNKSWNLVKYRTPNGNESQGWVATEYLTTNVVQEQPGPKVINGIHVNTSGTVTGIDVSTLSPTALREVLETGIADECGSVHGTFDTSQISGKVNYVYIKLGASSYGNGDFTVLDYDNYIEQVAICEELGVPYGFYYYSTAINIDEANIELNCIKDRIEDLRQRYNMENNLLEIAVDIELTDVHDRQYRGDILEQTQAKAALINGIQNQNLSENVLIYGPSRVMQPNLDQIFDLQYLNDLLDNPEGVSLWQCSLMNRNGSLKSNLSSDIAYGEKNGFSTSACQSGLDIFVKSNGKVIGLIDINQMSFEHFNELTSPKRENNNIIHTLEFKQNNKNEKTTYSLENHVNHDDELEI